MTYAQERIPVRKVTDHATATRRQNPGRGRTGRNRRPAGQPGSKVPPRAPPGGHQYISPEEICVSPVPPAVAGNDPGARPRCLVPCDGPSGPEREHRRLRHCSRFTANFQHRLRRSNGPKQPWIRQYLYRWRDASLLILKYSRTRTQPPALAPGLVSVRVCAKLGMPETILNNPL